MWIEPFVVDFATFTKHSTIRNYYDVLICMVISLINNTISYSSNMKVVTSGTGTTNSSGAHEFTMLLVVFVLVDL